MIYGLKYCISPGEGDPVDIGQPGITRIKILGGLNHTKGNTPESLLFILTSLFVSLNL